MAKFKPMTAEESGKVLANDPEYQAMMLMKREDWQRQEAALQNDERPLVAALRSTGRRIGGKDIESVWDLVHTAESYPELLPVLSQHLTRDYHLRNLEGIARALAVREARQTPIPRLVLNELKKQTDPTQGINSYRWALINTLVLIGDRSMVAEVRELVLDPRYETVKTDLNRLVRKLCRARQSVGKPAQ